MSHYIVVFNLNLKTKITLFQIRRLAGVEYSKEQQLVRLEALRTQLRLKQDLLLKYRHMYSLADFSHFETKKI